jgi:hypothetical protein
MDKNIHTQHSSKLTIWKRFTQWINYKRFQYRLNRLIRKGYISDTYEPLKCINCNSTRLRWTDTDTLDNIVLEKEVSCNDCNEVIAYWITGNWDFTIHEP